MIPARLKLLVLLLPLFIARSLLPIGFMLSFDEGIARIVFCSGEIPAPASTSTPAQHTAHHVHDAHAQHQAQQTHEHHHGGAESGTVDTEQSHQTCPFAFAAAAPLACVDAFAAEPLPAEAIAAPQDSAILIATSRAHRIRGPPAFS